MSRTKAKARKRGNNPEGAGRAGEVVKKKASKEKKQNQ
jgi:hypothetical protein